MEWGLYLVLAVLGVLSFGGVGGAVYLATRRRFPRFGQAWGWLVLALVVLSIVPAPLPAEASLVSFSLAGKGSAPLRVDPGAPLELGAGVRVEGDNLSWDCAACYASGGTVGLHVPPYARSVALAGDVVRLENGSLDAYASRAPCPAIPLLFATLFGAFPCEAGCREQLHAEGTGDARLVATGTRLCT